MKQQSRMKKYRPVKEIDVKKWSLAGAKGFEPPIYSLGGCRHIRARPRAHDEFPEYRMKQYCKTAFQVKYP